MHGTIKRDYEYKRLGTVSLLAAIDLLTGEVVPLVRDKHTSEGFIEFLKILNVKYPEGDIIRIILDNHSVLTSKKIKAFLATVLGRFIFSFMPKHGSWLNMIEVNNTSLIRDLPNNRSKVTLFTCPRRLVSL